MKTYVLFDNKFFTQKPYWMPEKLYNVVYHRSNPRSKEYMLQLLSDFLMSREIELVSKIELIPSEVIQIILLYSDSIGLGFSSLEKQCFKKFKSIKVLNGRKRYFELTVISWYKLLFKRFLEITFLPEIVFSPFIIAIGFILAIKDKLLGQA